VTIDPMFAQTVNLEAGYHVFIQVYGDASVFVTDRTPETFTVRLREGQPDVEFSYRIVAKRLGFEDLRLAVAADPTLAREAGTTPSSAQ
jgi:DNA-binding transcriptional LysR family regulator